MERVRKHIYFSGRVQGVGFRYRAMHLAEAHDLTGWVSNLWDGRVEMEAQGDEREIYHMLSELNTGMFISVDDCEIKDVPLCEEEHRFKVRGY